MPYFASMTQSQDNLHDTAFPKVKHTQSAARLCFYHKLRNSKSFLSVFLSLWWIRKKMIQWLDLVDLDLISCMDLSKVIIYKEQNNIIF